MCNYTGRNRAFVLSETEYSAQACTRSREAGSLLETCMWCKLWSDISLWGRCPTTSLTVSSGGWHTTNRWVVPMSLHKGKCADCIPAGCHDSLTLGSLRQVAHKAGSQNTFTCRACQMMLVNLKSPTTETFLRVVSAERFPPHTLPRLTQFIDTHTRHHSSLGISPLGRFGGP